MSYKRKFNEYEEESNVPLIGDNFEMFFNRNAVQHYDYQLQSVGYAITIGTVELININLWLDECYFKSKGRIYYVEHKKVGAKISIPTSAIEIYSQREFDNQGKKGLILYGKVARDKNEGVYQFIFIKN